MKTFKALTLIFFCVISIGASAQYYENKPKDKPSSFKDKIFFGGGLGLQFGTVTQIEVSPIIGYKITERWHAGIGLSYSYYNQKLTDTLRIDFSTYSGSIFTRFFIYEGLFAHAEIEMMNTAIFTRPNYDSYRKWIDSYLIGGGYFQRLGKRSGVYFMILWNLNETEFTPYSNPVMRIGFSF